MILQLVEQIELSQINTERKFDLIYYNNNNYTYLQYIIYPFKYIKNKIKNLFYL